MPRWDALTVPAIGDRTNWLPPCRSVVAWWMSMKPMAVEFTLTLANVLKTLGCGPDDPPLEEGHEEIRFRVVIGTGCYYRQQNVLGEDVWTSIANKGPLMGSACRWMEFNHTAVMMQALGHLAGYLNSGLVRGR